MERLQPWQYLAIGLRSRQDPLFCRYLKGRRTLDIGCGEGLFLSLDRENFVGVDISERMVESCAKKGLNARVMSALDLEFDAESFDAVHMAQIIEHFDSAGAAALLAEAARVVRKGGILFITTPGIDNVWNTFSHVRPYPPTAFDKLLNRPTEDYIGTRLPLRLEAWYGNRRYLRNGALRLLSNAFDILLPPRHPIGWTIILRKH